MTAPRGLGGGRFHHLSDGGRCLELPLRDAIGDEVAAGEAVLLAVVPNGVPVALALAACTGLPVLPLDVDRPPDASPVVHVPAGVGARTAVVVDDGVETGTVARLAAAALRSAGVERRVLAVPVCPRDAEAQLALLYDHVAAATRPLGRRSLAWHYDLFDTIDEAEARRRLAAAGFPAGGDSGR